VLAAAAIHRPARRTTQRSVRSAQQRSEAMPLPHHHLPAAVFSLSSALSSTLGSGAALQKS
jgi:hypothetical protein